MTNGKYSEVKTVELPLGYGVDEPVENELNVFLGKGYDLIEIVTCVRYNPSYGCTVTHHYAFVGLPRA